MKIAIIGAAELGRLIALHATNDTSYQIAGYYDDYSTSTAFNDYPVLGKTESISRDYQAKLFDALIIGIGYNQMKSRAAIFEQFKGKIPFCNIIHSSSYIDKTCTLGEGIFILPGVTLDLDVELGDNVLLNTGTIIAHHTKIGKHSFVAPGVNIAGLVNVGEQCFIGIGATIVDCLTIADSSVIGAGALVLKNTEENSVSVGAPAKAIKYNTK